MPTISQRGAAWLLSATADLSILAKQLVVSPQLTDSYSVVLLLIRLASMPRDGGPKVGDFVSGLIEDDFALGVD